MSPRLFGIKYVAGVFQTATVILPSDSWFFRQCDFLESSSNNGLLVRLRKMVQRPQPEGGAGPAYYTAPIYFSAYRTGTSDVASAWVKWDSNGYRPPPESEWEKAARGRACEQNVSVGDGVTVVWRISRTVGSL